MKKLLATAATLLVIAAPALAKSKGQSMDDRAVGWATLVAYDLKCDTLPEGVLALVKLANRDLPNSVIERGARKVAMMYADNPELFCLIGKRIIERNLDKAGLN